MFFKTNRPGVWRHRGLLCEALHEKSGFCISSSTKARVSRSINVTAEHSSLRAAILHLARHLKETITKEQTDTTTPLTDGLLLNFRTLKTSSSLNNTQRMSYEVWNSNTAFKITLRNLKDMKMYQNVSQSDPYRPPGGVEEMQGGGRRVRLEWGAYITI
ncbi:hypothetical protein FHG87_005135 [Trinorchestia longiramus]|nr:hypothetical protein FHG87_005135 [Trinorchestia longiramus]